MVKSGVFDKATALLPADVFKPWRAGWKGFSSPTQRHLSNAQIAPLFIPPNASHRIPMTYSNDFNNASFYPTSSTPSEFEQYPFLGRTSVTEEADVQAYHPFADPWSMTGWPRHPVGSPASLRAEVGYGKCIYNLFIKWRLTREFPEPVAPATPYMTQTNGYGQPSYSGSHWPAIGHRARPYHSDFLSRDGSFTSTEASEVSTVITTPSSGENIFYFETLGK